MVQKAYYQVHGKRPIEDGVEVISVRGLSFKRFLEIAHLIGIKTHVITDNDGSVKSLEHKYTDFHEAENIHITIVKERGVSIVGRKYSER